MNRPKPHRPSSVRAAWQQLHLVDRCLLILMAVLLAQSTYTLFFPGGDSQLSGSIDIVVRTSAASIFGYFLSANFAARDQQEPSTPSPLQKSAAAPPESTPDSAAAPKNQIGFVSAPTPPPADRRDPDTRGRLFCGVSPVLQASGPGSRLHGAVLPGGTDPHTKHGIGRHLTGRIQCSDRHRLPVPGFCLRLRGISHRLPLFPAEQLIPSIPGGNVPEKRGAGLPAPL